MFPAQVVRPWIEGRCPESGQLLPGYNDAQTLFMLGEDSGTCMMVRARQKSTNRALLSFVLHGNVRVLGTKDATGKLQQRAVCRLLVDQATKAPVLYVLMLTESCHGYHISHRMVHWRAPVFFCHQRNTNKISTIQQHNNNITITGT